MIRLHRPALPDCLVENEESWGEEYRARRSENASHRFQWKTCQGVTVNLLLLPHLRRMTAGHCAYCDGFPLGPFARETIDHFRPKSRFESEVYRWSNLFLACDVCQNAKGEDFAVLALKPDTETYSFDRYFLFNFRTGDIEPNPSGTTPEEQEMARQTITWLGLNDHNRPEYRRSVFQEDYLPRPRKEVDALPYRFLMALVPPRDESSGDR